MKKLIHALILMVLSIGLASCVVTPIDDLLEDIKITYQGADSAEAVTQSVLLPSRIPGEAQATITWSSSHPNVIDQIGTVIRPEETVSVTLTATLTYLGQSRDKAFVLSVTGLYRYAVVTYNIDGVQSIDQIERNTKLSMPDAPTKDGHRFLGWYTDSNMTIPYQFNQFVLDDLMLYAKFEPILTGTYTINVYRENIEDDDYVMVGFETGSEEIGTLITYDLELEGYEFNDDIGTRSGYVSETPLTLEVYYRLTRHRVTIYADGIEIYDDFIKYGAWAEEPEAPSKEGYDFIGWSKSALSNDPFTFDTVITESLTLYARWQISGETTYTGYYEGADGLTSSALETFLYQTLNNGLNLQDYDAARQILQITDRDPNNASNIILVYRGTSVLSTWDGGTTWNREHVWPQSLLGVSASGSVENAASDLHNLKPANPAENSSRGNKYFDISTTSVSYEPRDEVKGDIARILFYMDVAYAGYTLVNSSPGVYQMGKLDTLLAWHDFDPVDDFERNRNDVIFSYQNNRNPFIDHPEFVDKLYGDVPISQEADEYIWLNIRHEILWVAPEDRYVIIKKDGYQA